MFRTGFVGRQFPAGLGAGTASGASASLDMSLLGPTLDSRITFTRASTATYFDSSGVMQTAAINAPRFDYDPVSRQQRGLLIEEGRTNLILQSADISNAAWAKTNITVAAPVVTGNAAVAPDGTTTASQIVFPAVSGAGAMSSFSQQPTVTAAIYSFSIWLRGNAGGEVLYLWSLLAGTYYRQQVTLTTSWQRFTVITGTLTAAGWFFQVGCDLRDAGQSATSAMTIFAWGGQVEVNFPTSYIPTAASTVTRSPDVCTMPLGSWFNTNAGTFDAEWITNQAAASGTQAGILRWDDTTANNAMNMFISSASQCVNAASVATVLQINSNSGTPAFGVINRSSMCWNNGSQWTAQLNASNQLLGSGTNVASGLTRLIIGSSSITVTQWTINGWIRRIRYWPRQLSNGDNIQVNGDSTLDIGFIDPVGGLDPRITLTRAFATGTYIDANKQIQVAAANTARFDHDVATGNALGLLIEESRSNALVSSDNALNFSSSTDGAGEVPVLKAGARINKITWPSGQTNGPNNVNIPVVASTTYTATCYLWLPATYNATIDGPPVLNMDIGVIGSGGSNTVTPADLTKRNQWQRLQTVVVTGTGSSTTINFVIRRSGPLGGGQTCYVTCPQVETGAFPTSYIPSTASPPTARAADVVTTPVGPWFNQSASALMSEAIHNVAGTAGNWQMVVRLDDGTNANRMQLFRTSGSVNFNAQDTAASVDQLNAVIGTVTGAVLKAGIAAQAGTQRAAMNGGAVSSASGASHPSNITTLRVGCDQANSLFLNGTVRRVRYWPRVLSATELQAATT